MGETPSTFHPSFNAGVVIEARVERLTSDAGAVIVVSVSPSRRVDVLP